MQLLGVILWKEVLGMLVVSEVPYGAAIRRVVTN
jgi:hypothetical protein